MKIQDFIFLTFLFFLFSKKDAKLFVLYGLSLLVLSMPLFAKWIFFTAERFTWYAALLFLIAIVFQIASQKQNER